MEKDVVTKEVTQEFGKVNSIKNNKLLTIYKLSRHMIMLGSSYVLVSADSICPQWQSRLVQSPQWQSRLGQTPLVQSPLVQSPLVQSPLGQTPLVPSPLGQTPLVQSPLVLPTCGPWLRHCTALTRTRRGR